MKKRVKVTTRHGWHDIPTKYYDPAVHGLTFSLLSKWKNCRERARLHLQGWTPRRSGSGMIFGTVVHAFLEVLYRDVQFGRLKALPSLGDPYFKDKLIAIDKAWRAENPKADRDTIQQLELCVTMAEVVLVAYCKYWKADIKKIAWKQLEHQFVLPRTAGTTSVPIRGKMDGRFVNVTPGRAQSRTQLFETKTKSRLGEQGESNLVDILPYELQVSLYLCAIEDMEGTRPGGLLYNIVRRPNLSPKKGESLGQFQDRLAADIAKRPDHYFIRLRMTIERDEHARNRAEQDGLFADFLAWYNGDVPHYRNSDQCENKYGTCEFLRICGANDYAGFYKRPTVFRELEDV